MKKAIHCFVDGRVQGVCFRMATRQQAILHGVTGWVRNLADGRVEVYACGETQKVDALRQWLGEGPEMARVVNVECFPAECEESDGFMIR